MSDNNSFEQWSEDGSKDTEQRAYERWNKMLDEYQQPALDPAIDEGLLEFVRVKKDDMEDEWY
jgi:trimethylamine--corrinoid protein Co-methyltransferase